ncbi:MAG: extracellular solute-binding protein [Chloroflexi bacterium]|nr:extracellular solute-binding protein [Chloroflexota bacterium]
MTSSRGGAVSPLPVVRVSHAGSLTAVLEQDILPAFREQTGYVVERTGGPAVGLANRIRTGELRSDGYLSADAETNGLLLGADNADLARWFVTIAATRMVLAYSPASRFAADFQAAAEGRVPWYEVLGAPGLALRRSDAGTDPGGYRAVFVMQLAERHYGVAGLTERILGGADNEAQFLAMGGMDRLKDGTVDALFTYVTGAIQGGLPYLVLPEEIDQSNFAMANVYAHASYTNPQGQTFRGTPAAYSATILTAAANPAGAEAFVRHVLSPAGRGALGQRGFLPAPVLLGGHAEALPPSLASFIQGRYPTA